MKMSRKSIPIYIKLNNVVLLPHLGSGTEDARNEMAKLAAKNIISVLNGKGSNNAGYIIIYNEI